MDCIAWLYGLPRMRLLFQKNYHSCTAHVDSKLDTLLPSEGGLDHGLSHLDTRHLLVMCMDRVHITITGALHLGVNHRKSMRRLRPCAIGRMDSAANFLAIEEHRVLSTKKRPLQALRGINIQHDNLLLFFECRVHAEAAMILASRRLDRSPFIVCH